MSHLNAGLSQADFLKNEFISDDERKGFNEKTVRVVTLTGPFKLYKLTWNDAPQGTRGVTPWWTSVDPYADDTEGAVGRFKQAYMNGIDMSSMVRFMSAVKVEWNDLTKYVEITIRHGCKVSCFWGEFAPLNLSEDPVKNKERRDKQCQTGSAELGYEPAVLPFEVETSPGVRMPFKIGVLRAWQFFIPNLTNDWIEGGVARTVIDAHDMRALGAHLRVDLGHVNMLRAARILLKDFQRRTQAVAPQRPRDATLQLMDRCVAELYSLSWTPQESLQRLFALGYRYVHDVSVPRPLKIEVWEILGEVLHILHPGQKPAKL